MHQVWGPVSYSRKCCHGSSSQRQKITARWCFCIAWSFKTLICICRLWIDDHNFSLDTWPEYAYICLYNQFPNLYNALQTTLFTNYRFCSRICRHEEPPATAEKCLFFSSLRICIYVMYTREERDLWIFFWCVGLILQFCFSYLYLYQQKQLWTWKYL